MKCPRCGTSSFGTHCGKFPDCAPISQEKPAPPELTLDAEERKALHVLFNFVDTKMPNPPPREIPAVFREVYLAKERIWKALVRSQVKP